MTARIQSFVPLILLAGACLAPLVRGEDLAAEEVFAVGTSAGVRIDTRTDETHWIEPGAVEELYGEEPWTAPAEAGVYELSHTESGAPWTARYEVVGADVAVVGDVDIDADATWGADRTWLVAGTVIVKGGATLTVEPGATILQPTGGSIVAKGGTASVSGVSIRPLGAGAVRATAASAGVRIDTRTEETHWIEPGAVETLYGESPWTAPAEAGVYELSHTEAGAPWTARYEVVGTDVAVVGDLDLDADATWGADKTWLVAGTVIVKGGATLTVEPGATILQPPGGSIVAKGGAASVSGVSIQPLGAGAVRATAASAGVRLDTRTEETHWIEPGAVETLYGEAPWTAPAEAGVYELSHTEAGAPWTARYEVVGADVAVVGDLDLDADATWGADKTWLVAGTVIVKGGATLTVEPGATILQPPGGSIVAKGGAASVSGVSIQPLGAGAVRATAASAGARIDMRTDETHWIEPGAVEELYGESPWTAPAEAGVYELSHTEAGAPWTARYEVVGANVAVVGDVDLDADATWGADRTWLVAGTVLVRTGATLTIEDGTPVVFDVGGSIVRSGGSVSSAGAAFVNRAFDGHLRYGEGAAENVFLDTSAGDVQLASGPESISFGTEWGEASSASVAVYWDGPDGVRRTLVAEDGPVEGDVAWEPSGIGCHDLWHVTDGETLTARFIAPDPEATLVVRGGTLDGAVEWGTDRVVLVSGTVTVPAGASLAIARGAVVKFMDGAGIVCEGGGTCFAEGVVFTHANDDTIGGDTLLDGETEPATDRYVLSGVQIDETTQCRYYPDTAVTLSGTIAANETWRGWNVYRVTGNLTIASGATLTIEPGAVVKFDPGVSLTVNSGATLNAAGTRARPIVFTSVRDDDHGGDTNGDGSKTAPQPGDWRKFSVNGTAGFDHVKILYASSGSGTEDAILVSGGTVFFNNSEMAFGQTYAVGVESGHFHATNSIIREYYCAFRHWPNDPIVNCVIYNCNRLSNNNGQKLYNCAIVGVNEAWDWSSGGGNTYCNCVFWNEPEFGLQSLPSSASVANGNVWGDPLFTDPDNGDFKIAEGSPCIDSGLASVAPETDHYGQPRVNAPDIGIYEAVPRSVAGEVDLVPRSVAADAEASPGAWLAVTWEVANDGAAMANASRRDTVSLVSASGRTVTLGDKVLTQRIPAGGSVSCSAAFCVPALSEGDWYPKVVVNSYQDIFEGALIANNALTAAEGVAVALPSLDPAEPASGVVNAGIPTVLKLSFADGDDNRMVKLDLPAGVKVTYGFGFLPQGASRSGAVVATADDVMFRVPDDATDVYVVLESDATASYALSTATTKLAVTGVSPATLPSSGTTTLTIAGAGFGDENVVTLSGADGSYRVPTTAKDASGALVATVDCAELKAGTTYDLVVSGGSPSSATATLPGAVSVATVKGEGKLEAKLDIPDSARQGRAMTGFVEYGNVGQAGMPAPVFILRAKSGDVLFKKRENGSFVWTNELWLVGIGSSYPKGTLAAGAEMRIPFTFKVVNDYSMALGSIDSSSAKVRESVFPTWTEFAEGIADAATALNGSDGLVFDYDPIYDHAIRMAYGDDCGVVAGQVLDDLSGEPVPDRVVAAVDQTGEVWARVVTDETGSFVFSSLCATNVYAIIGCGFDSEPVSGVVPEKTALTPVVVSGHDYATFGAGLFKDGLPFEADGYLMVLRSARGSKVSSGIRQPGGAYRFEDISDGVYVLAVECPEDCAFIAGETPEVVVESGKTGRESYAIEMTECGHLTVCFTCDGNPESGVRCEVACGEARLSGVSGPDGVASFAVKPGEWSISVGNGHVMNSGGNPPVAVDAGATAVAERDVSFIPFSAFPDVGPWPLQVVFSVEGLRDPNAVASYEWDFDGDGITDSTEAEPQYIFRDGGMKSVSLTVGYTNGVSKTFVDGAAVDVWDEQYVVLDESTLLLDASSGYRIAARDEGSITLVATGEAVPADISQVEKIVFAGEETTPFEVVSYEVVDDAIVVELREMSALDAYQGCRLMSVSSLTRSTDEAVCTFKEIPVGEFTWSVELSREGKWQKKGTSRSRADVNVELELKSGPIYYLQAVEKDDSGKIILEISRFHGEWTPEFTLKGAVDYVSQRNRYRRGVKGDPFKYYMVEDQLLPIPCPVPISGSVGAKFEGHASIGGELKYTPKFRIDYGQKTGKHGDEKYDTFTVIDGGNLWAFDIVGEVDVFAGLFFEIYAGANKSLGKHKFGGKVFDLEVNAGVGAEFSFRVSPDEFVSDKYRLAWYAKAGLDFAPVEINMGLWKIRPLDLGWEDKYDLLAYEVETPVPSLSLGFNGYSSDGNANVSIVNTTSLGKWELLESALDFGDGSGTCLIPGESLTHEFAAVGIDKRKYTVKLREHYSYTIFDPWKANEYVVTVWGKDPETPEKPIEVGKGRVPKSCDPNEMVGPLGVGDPETERQLVPGEWATYTVYFENQTNATAAAQEVYVSEALSANLDWSTFEMCEVAFGDQIDLGLAGKKNGTSDATMTGTNLLVRTSLALDETTGLATWYMRIVDPTTDTGWPTDILAGFLPPNDPETHCGEGHLTYRVKVREDAAPGARIDASATIVFDYNEPIVTDPSWWNTVATAYKPVLDLGDGTTAEIVLVVGQPYGDLPTPAARAGYAFGGWFTGLDGTGTKITPTTIVQEGDSGLFPHWIKQAAPAPTTYKVVFDPNGGTGTMAAQTVVRGATAKLAANRFSKKGCVFLGWAKTKTGAVAYANGASVKDLAAAGGTATLYAQWAVSTYTVAFDKNGGKLPKGKKMAAQTMAYGKVAKLRKNVFTRTGYVFAGWAVSKADAKKGVVAYANAQSVKNIRADGKTTTLYAVWAKPKYKVAFYANGGKGATVVQTLKYGKATKLKANQFKAPKGKKFAGWATGKANAKKGKVAYKNKKSVKNLTTTGKTVKLYAVWKKK